MLFPNFKAQFNSKQTKNVDGHFFRINALYIRTLKHELQLTSQLEERRAFRKHINQCWEPSDEPGLARALTTSLPVCHWRVMVMLFYFLVIGCFD